MMTAPVARHPAGARTALGPVAAGGLTVRPVRPSDGPALHDLYEALSPESRHARFLGFAHLDRAAARAMASADGVARCGLVAVERETEAVVGHLCLEPAGAEGREIGIAVADRCQGHGIGRALLLAGRDWARRRGVRSLYGVALANNSRMLRLASSIGSACTLVPIGDGLVRATITVDPSPWIPAL